LDSDPDPKGSIQFFQRLFCFPRGTSKGFATPKEEELSSQKDMGGYWPFTVVCLIFTSVSGGNDGKRRSVVLRGRFVFCRQTKALPCLVPGFHALCILMLDSVVVWVARKRGGLFLFKTIVFVTRRPYFPSFGVNPTSPRA